MTDQKVFLIVNLLLGISMWHLSLRFSHRLFIAIVSQIQKITVDPGCNGCFLLVFCRDSKNQDVPLQTKNYGQVGE